MLTVRVGGNYRIKVVVPGCSHLEQLERALKVIDHEITQVGRLRIIINRAKL